MKFRHYDSQEAIYFQTSKRNTPAHAYFLILDDLFDELLTPSSFISCTRRRELIEDAVTHVVNKSCKVVCGVLVGLPITSFN